MRIIEPGEPGLDRRHIRFTCQECWCVFEEKREQVTEQQYMLERSLVSIEFETRCPWCAAQVTTEVWFEKTSRKP